MLASFRVLAASLALGYLAVVAAPCPTPLVAGEAGHEHATHTGHAAHATSHHGAHENAPSTALEARCPCGCDERSTAASAGPGKPGASLPVSLEDHAPAGRAAWIRPASHPALCGAFPTPDPVPI